MGFLRRIAPVVVLLGVGSLALGRLMGMAQEGGPTATRATAALFLICDVSISSSLVILLVTREFHAPAWLERRLPSSGRWLRRILIGLTVLCYASLAPTFLFFLVQMRK